MLTTIILPLLVSYNNIQAPTIAEIQSAKAVVNVFQLASEKRTEFLAGGKRRAPGPDHGDDPNDEQHDGGLPANKEAGNGFPSGDPYNDTLPNGRKPY